MPEEILDDQAIHTHFGLSYASFLVLPRIALQSMPSDWQRKFVEMLDQIPDHLPDLSNMEPSSYKVLQRDQDGRFIASRFPNYRHNNLRTINDTPENAPWHFKPLTMTKQQLTNSVADQTGYDADMVLRVIEVTNDTIRKQVAKGHTVTLRGFGTYRPLLKSKTVARNISLGITIPLAPKYYPVFKASQRFRDIVGKIKVETEQFQTV